MHQVGHQTLCLFLYYLLGGEFLAEEDPISAVGGGRVLGLARHQWGGAPGGKTWELV